MKIIRENITTLFLDIVGVMLTSGRDRMSRQLAIIREITHTPLRNIFIQKIRFS
jgi:hypothetical protein